MKTANGCARCRASQIYRFRLTTVLKLPTRFCLWQYSALSSKRVVDAMQCRGPYRPFLICSLGRRKSSAARITGDHWDLRSLQVSFENKLRDAVTIRQLVQRKFLHAQSSCQKQQPSSMKVGNECVARQTAQLPLRPDETVLSDSIPLFFIGRNQNGFWVAREAAGRCGGIFFFRWSAARFARKNVLTEGGATMLVEHSIELDLPNRGSRLAGLIAITMDIVKRRAPFVT